MTPDEAIAIVKSKAECRTRYDGQGPRVDEVLVAEVERLRDALRDMVDTVNIRAASIDWCRESPAMQAAETILSH